MSIAEDIVCGLQCSHCGIRFRDEHGYPVLCKDCYKNEYEKEHAGLSKATIEEF